MKTLACLGYPVLLALAACATQSEVLEEGEDQPSEESQPSDKSDDYGYEIRFGTHTNAEPNNDELVKLVLSRAPTSELPYSYFEGRYTLEEKRDGATKRSSGFFNTYTSGGERWIRFLDERTRGYETAFPKYSWVYWKDSLVLSGPGSDSEFYLDLPFYGTRVNCTLTTLHDDNVFEEGLSIDEYPDVSITRNVVDQRLEVSIGSWSFDSADGDSGTFNVSGPTATATLKVGDDTIKVAGPTRGNGKGTVTITEHGATRPVADLDCNGITIPVP